MRNLFILLMMSLSILWGSSPSVSSTELQLIREHEIQQVIEEFVRSRSAAPGIELKIKKTGYRGDLSLPAGQVEYEVKAPQQWEGWGNVNLALIVRIDGRVMKNIPIRVEVEALTEMLVTTRQIEQGEIIGEADLSLQKRDLASAGAKIVRNRGDAVGRRLKTSLRGNVPLRSDQLEKLPLVKSGQIVTILLDNELIRITATGRSKGAGSVGDIVMVQNIVSQKDIQARVVDSSTVRVEF
jgi:flagella basal body P-ring formation protein FlgA